MKDYLKKLIAEYREAIEKSEDANEVRALGAKKAEAEAQLAQIEADERAASAPATLNTVGSFQNRNENVDKFDTPEYRKAFMEFACRGVAMPADMRATTATGDVGAAIPTTIANEIVQKLESYGNLFAKVTKLNIQGGVKIPVISLKPTATWVGEGKSDAQKVGANDSVSFSYFGLECKIAQTLLASIVTIEQFQKTFVPLAVEAIAKALDIAIVNGEGAVSCLGILKDNRVPAENVIELSAADFASWSGWKKKVFAKMKKSYRKGEFIMAQGTFDGYIDGMEDKNGQPIGRVNYGIDGGETYRFGGKTVDTVEDDVIAPYDTAEAGAVVAVFVNLADYAVNSNMQLTTVKWIDNDTNEVKTKVMLIVDGKLADPNGVLIIKKGA